MKENISMSVVRRLPRYYRYLSELVKNGTLRISSRELAERMGLTASQIRQDLNCFGGFGQQGYGYDVPNLYNEIAKILGVNRSYTAVLVGCGNLGRAVSSYLIDISKVFHLIAAFDSSKEKIGHTISEVPILDSAEMSEFCLDNSPKAAILCIPYSAAKETVDTLYSSGVRYFWNFSHYDISMVYKDAIVENVHITDSMMTLCYEITCDENGKAESNN